MKAISVEQTILRDMRRYRNISQEYMADLIGVKSKETYANKEKGRTQFLASEMFIIANHFGMKINEIFLPPNFINHEVDEMTQ